MSIAQMKKRAKNAQHLLPDFIASHKPPYSLAECQAFVASLDGYPNWHAVETKLKSQPINKEDPLAAFYQYDWSKIQADTFLPLPNDMDVQIHCCQSKQVERCMMERVKARGQQEVVLFVINTTTDSDVDELFFARYGGEELRESISFQSCISEFGSIGQYAGLSVNPLLGMEYEKASFSIYAMLEPLLSQRQKQCTKEALQLLTELAALEIEEIEITSIYVRLVQLICLANGGKSKDVDLEFYDLFPEESMHDAATDFFERYGDNLPALLRPLDALLTRLESPGLVETLNPWVSMETHAARAPLLDDSFSTPFSRGLHFINIDFGGATVNHIASLLVLMRILHQNEAQVGGELFPLNRGLEIVLIHP